MNAVFITNAGPDIGGGHLSRCLALAQALELRGASCSWILNEDAAPQSAALGIDGAFFLKDIFCRESVAVASGADFAVVDSYDANADFFRDIAIATRLVAIDDLRDRGAWLYADAVINYGFDAPKGLHPPEDCRCLLGPTYALLRKEYWTLAPEEGSYVLFVPGAADVAETALDMAAWWREGLPELAIALGPLVSPSRAEAVRETASAAGNVKILHAPGEFPAILSRAKFVICTASVTAYEALAMEKKTAVFFVAANQDKLGGLLEEMGAAYNIGEWRVASREKIERALSFSPGGTVLRGIVNPRGAIACAEELLRLPNRRRHGL
jgi:spore coat polysaccharide biosynthesis predicted glycosyltransferase SpsG